MGARYTSDQYDFLQQTMSREKKPRRLTPQEIKDKLELEKIQSATRAAQKPEKKNKYNNKKVIVDGLKFDSKKESARWIDLCMLQKAGKITNLQRQVNLSLDVNGMKVCGMRPDFSYHDADTGKMVYEDVKGMRWGRAYEMFRIKAKLFRAIHGYDIVEI